MNRRKTTLSAFCILLFLSAPVFLHAQLGKDGARTISSAGVVVNDYTLLTADVTAGSTSVQVGSSFLSANFSSALTAGDLIFIIQMQGVEISTSDDSLYGGIINYHDCGNHEFAQVSSVPTSTQINLMCPLSYGYSAGAKTQIIRVPRLTTLTISSGNITCPAWNGNTGGAVVIEVEGPAVISSGASVDVTGKGFRAGSITADNNAIFGVLNYRWPTNDYGAEKGEGVVGSQGDYDALNGRYCKGAPANGGGGASSHNSGGGGGANAGTMPWTGRGNPSLSTASWANAWNLEYSGFASSTSSGGGKGGYSFSSSNQNALTTGIFNSAWGGDQRRDNGGRGGRALDYSTGKIFLGGGGGSGDQNDLHGGSGGNGGGLVYFLCYNSITGSGQINSNGQNGVSTSGAGTDGAGGGGGGGTIILDATGSVSGITANANGGNGGNQNVGIFVDEAEGPGGGGGGGYISILSGAITRNANGGANGITNSFGMTEFPPNGATNGGGGQPFEILDSYHILTSSANVCGGTSTTLSFTSLGSVPSGTIYSWYDQPVGGTLLGNGITFNTPVLTSGPVTYYVSTCPGSARFPIQVNIDQHTVSFTAPPVCLGNPITFTPTVSSGATTVSSWSWNFGDATSSSSQTPTHTYGSVSSYNATLTITDNIGCTFSTTQSVNVTSGPSVNFSSSSVSGCSPFPVTFTNATTNATSYTWNFGDGSPTSSQTAPSHNYQSPGAYSVTLTATDGSCTSSVTIPNMVTVYPVPISSFSAPSPVCLGDSVIFTNLSSSNGATITGYSWNFNDFSPLSTQASPHHIFPSAGNYNVVLVTNSINCFDDTTITININSGPVASFSAPVTSGCIPFTVNFNNTTGGSPIYTWNFGDGSATSSATSPSHTYSTSGNYSVTLIASQGSCADTLIIPNMIQTGAAPVASFSAAPSACLGDTIVFTNNSTGSVTSYDWDFNDGTTTTVTTTTAIRHLYATAGSYSVHLTAHAGGCSDDSTFTVTVNPSPVVNFSTPSTSACGSLNASFANTTTGTPSYTWNFGDGSPSSALASPSHLYSVAGSYTVTLIASQGSCADTLIRTNYISIHNQPLSSFTTANVCLGDSVHFTNLATGNGDPIINFTWNFGDATSSVATSPAHLYSGAGSYNVTLTVNTANCSDDTTISVTVSPGPVANFNTATTTVCGIQNVSFNNTTTGTPAYSWNFGDGSALSSLATPAHTYTAAGIYSVTLIATQGSCADTMTRSNYISVFNQPLSSFTTANVCLGDSVHFINLASGNGSPVISSTWNFGDATSSTLTAPSHIYSSAGSYNVTLTVNTANCSDDTTISVTVSPGPVAGFTSSATTVCGVQNISFNNTTSGTPLYSWNFGDGSSLSTLPTPTHSYSSSGVYSVTLIATQGSCADTLTKLNYISVFNQPLSSFSTANVCAGDSVHFANLSSGSGDPLTSTSWNFGDGGISSSNNPAHLYSVTGTYNVLLSVSTGNCSDDTTVSVTVSPAPVVNFSAPVTNACGGVAVNFSNTTTGSPVFAWNFGDGSSSSSASTPTHSYTSPGVYSVTLIASQGSCADTLTRANYITVNSEPQSSFSTAAVCVGDSSHFSDLSVINGGTITSHTWTFGDGGTSSLPSPSYLYSSAGTYNVNLVVSTGTCSDDTTITVEVNSSPVVNFSSSLNDACENADIQFTNTTTPSSAYSWNFGDGGTSTQISPSHVYSTPGTFSVLLTATAAGGCSSSKAVINMITIHPKPAATFTTSQASFCQNDCVAFAEQSGTGNTNWSWQFAGGNPSSSISQSPPLICYSNTGDYNVTFSVSNGFCSDTVTKNSYIHIVNCSSKPQADFISSDTSLCGGSCIDFVDLSLNSVTWLWSFPGATPASSTQENPSGICYSSPGVYDVVLIAGNPSGSDTMTLNSFINVATPPSVPSFTQSGNILTSTPATQYQWYYNNIPVSGATSQQYTATLSGMYSVVITDRTGCSASSPQMQVTLVGIEEASDDHSFFLYPNPAGESIFILSREIVSGNYNFILKDELGRTLYFSREENISRDFVKEISLKEFAAGVYFLTVQSENRYWVRSVIHH